MKLSDLTKLIIGVLFTIGFIVLTAIKIVPVEAFIAVAPAVIIYIVNGIAFVEYWQWKVNWGTVSCPARR